MRWKGEGRQGRRFLLLLAAPLLLAQASASPLAHAAERLRMARVFLCADCRDDIARDGANLPQRRAIPAGEALEEARRALEGREDAGPALRHIGRALAALGELDERGAIRAIDAARNALRRLR
jgi:hypothetical protein